MKVTARLKQHTTHDTGHTTKCQEADARNKKKDGQGQEDAQNIEFKDFV